VEEAVKQRILIVFVFLFASEAGAQVYTITDLGAFSPTAINTWGQVVGNLSGHAYIWTRYYPMLDLGTLPGGTSSSAAAINDNGMVAGMADGVDVVKGLVGTLDGTTKTCTDVLQAFVWTREKGMQGLGTVDVDANSGDFAYWCEIISYASGVDFFGQVVGTNDWADNTYQNGFSWTKAGGLTLLTVPTTDYLVYYNDRSNAINNRSEVVGIYGCCSVESEGHAALWTNSGVLDLGTLGGTDLTFEYCSEASDINDQGQIVGWSTLSPLEFPCVNPISTHAVFWTQDGSIRDLGTLPGDSASQAYKINLFDQVIGISGGTFDWVYPPGRSILAGGRPFVWTNKSGMRDLNTLIRPGSGWVLNSVSDINIWGQIIGSGTLNGESHGFLLTPRELLADLP
jgi:probable HAF family extracellular repeat protein